MVKNNSPQSSSPKRWLISGGCGFIGTSLIRKLLNEYPDSKIRVLDNLSVGTKEDLQKVCTFNELSPQSAALSPDNEAVALIAGDIKDPETCRTCCAGMDIVVHLAANTGVGPSVEYPEMDMASNVVGTFNMLRAARDSKVGRFVFASSGAPAGEVTPPIHENIAPKPVSPYGASKLAGEGYCSAFFRTYGLKTVTLRFGNVYGPGSTHKSSVVAKFIRQALAGQICEIYGDGGQTRDFIYIGDITSAITNAATIDDSCHSGNTQSSPFIGQSRPSPWGEVFQIATNKEHTVNEVTEMLKRCLLDHNILMRVQYGETRLGDVRRNYSDTSKAKKILNWQARTSLEKGLKETVQYFFKGVTGAEGR